MAEFVAVREVGLRDGLQMVASVLPAERKLAWCRAELSAGVREMEVTSFVPPRVMPQFVDADEVGQGALALPELKASALVVNLKGAQRAFAAGFKHVGYVVSASEAHSRANARRSTDDAVAEFVRIREARDAHPGGAGIVLSVAIATAFGCTLQGPVAPARVVAVAETLLSGGAEEIMLADTVGYADPAGVGSLFRALSKVAGGTPLSAHFHDTRGLGLANVCAALEAGVRRFDASLGGLGGCPFAPGATGNIALEDTVFLLERLGFDTGIDLPALLALMPTVAAWLPGERFGGALARAGLPRTAPAPELVRDEARAGVCA